MIFGITFVQLDAETWHNGYERETWYSKGASVSDICNVIYNAYFSIERLLTQRTDK